MNYFCFCRFLIFFLLPSLLFCALFFLDCHMSNSVLLSSSFSTVFQPAWSTRTRTSFVEFAVRTKLHNIRFQNFWKIVCHREGISTKYEDKIPGRCMWNRKHVSIQIIIWNFSISCRSLWNHGGQWDMEITNCMIWTWNLWVS